MPNLSPWERRRRAVFEGKKPKVTDEMRTKYLRLRIEKGWSNIRASKETGFHPNTGSRLWTSLSEEAKRREALEHPPDPIPYMLLSEEAKRACADPGFFAGHYLGLTFGNWVWELIRELLEAYHSDEDEYLILNAHPGSGKTTAVTYIFTSWVGLRERAMGKEPRIFLGHKTERKSKLYLTRIARLLTTNAAIVRDFGRCKPWRSGPGIPWSSEELLLEPLSWDGKMEKEPTYSIGSYDGTILSGRYDLIIWDDLLDNNNQTSPQQREKVVEWWDQEAENRLDPGGLLVLSNARYGPDDLCHTLLSQRTVEDDGEEHPEYRRIIFPLHDDSKCKVEDEKVAHAGNWPEGCLLDIERLTKTRPPNPRSAWRRVRHWMRNERKFRIVYQQEDVEPSGFLAERPWFSGGEDSRRVDRIGCFNRDRSFGQLPERQDRPILSAVSVDPSAERYWGVIWFVAYQDLSHAVMRGYRRVLKTPELIYRENDNTYTGLLEDLWQESLSKGVPYTHLIMESNGFMKWFRQPPYVREWAMSRNISLTPHDTSRANKMDPDYGVQSNGPVYRDGRIDIPYVGIEERIFADQFAQEACSWPEGNTSDLVMAHWFLTYRLPQLAVANYETTEPTDVPSWAQEASGRPAWLGEVVA